MAGKGSLYVFYCFSYAFRVRWGGIRPSRSGKTKTIADTISMYSISWVGNTTHGMKCMSSYKRGSRVRCTEERSMQRSRKRKQGRVWRARIVWRPLGPSFTDAHKFSRSFIFGDCRLILETFGDLSSLSRTIWGRSLHISIWTTSNAVRYTYFTTFYPWR